MKTRIISAIIALSIFVPIIIYGGYIYTIAIYILSLLGLSEFIKLKETKKKLPDFVKFISYVAISFLVFGLNDITTTMSIGLPIISFILLL